MKVKKQTVSKKAMIAFIMVGPTLFWLAAFLVFPLIYAVGISFMEKGRYGGVEFILTLKNYMDMWNPIYFKVAAQSVKLAFHTSIICLLVAYPFAFILTRVSEKSRSLCMLLIMLPFWTNGLIRLNGWANILRDSGLINTFLLRIGIIEKPIRLLYTQNAITFGMVYTFLPFMVLPILTSLSKLDPALIEAAYDLGARRAHTFLRVILPLTIPGIFAGTVQVFIPSLGAFFIADIMGGGETLLYGNLITNQFLSARNWPLGAAFGVILIVFTLIVMAFYSRIGKIEDLA